MNRNTRKVLNWVIIAMVVMMPLRGVIALTQAPCDMHESASHVMDDHSMHTMHQMNASVQLEMAVSPDCCDSATHCGSDCGININVSFITQSVFAFPSLKKAAFHTAINSNLVFRELAPPIRPPAHLQI